MLVAVGMYLPFETTFAIFLGGVFRSVGRLGGGAARLQRGAKGAGGECRRPHRFRTDRRRSRTGTGLGWIAVCSGMGQTTDFQPPVISCRPRRDDRARGLDDLPAALERWRSERASAADSNDVDRRWQASGARRLSFVILSVLRGLLFCMSIAENIAWVRAQIADCCTPGWTKSRRNHAHGGEQDFPAGAYPRSVRSRASGLRRKPRPGICRQSRNPCRLERCRMAHDRPSANQQGRQGS